MSPIVHTRRRTVQYPCGLCFAGDWGWKTEERFQDERSSRIMHV